MTNPVINRPFPIFRVAALVILAIVGRILKYAFGVLSVLMAVFIAFVSVGFVAGYITLLEGGTLLETYTKMLAMTAFCLLISWVGEKIIQLNERLARSTAEYMGEDIDKI